MSTKPDGDNRLSELARLDSLESITWPDRIARALRMMDDAQSPLHVSSDVPGRGNDDDTIIQQSSDMRSARADIALEHPDLEPGYHAAITQTRDRYRTWLAHQASHPSTGGRDDGGGAA